MDYVAYLMAQNSAGRTATSARPEAPELVMATPARLSHLATFRHLAGRALRRMAETLDPPPAAPVATPLETC